MRFIRGFQAISTLRLTKTPLTRGRGVCISLIHPDEFDSTEIYYTTDGSDPNNSQTEPAPLVGKGNIYITEDTHLKLIAVEPGKEPSMILDSWYRFSAQPAAYSCYLSVEGLPEYNGKTFMGALFHGDTLDPAALSEPPFSGAEKIVKGGAVIVFTNVPEGTYYAAFLLDLDSSSNISTGDIFFPDDQNSGRETLSINSSGLSVFQHGGMALNDESSWYTIP